MTKCQYYFLINGFGRLTAWLELGFRLPTGLAGFFDVAAEATAVVCAFWVVRGAPKVCVRGAEALCGLAPTGIARDGAAAGDAGIEATPVLPALSSFHF